MSSELQLVDVLRVIDHRFSQIDKRMSKFETCNFPIYHETITETLRLERAARKANGGATTSELVNSITAIAGLREALTTEHRIFRFVWALLFCSGVGATLFYLYRTTVEFRTSPTATSIQLTNHRYNHFLPLLVCPPNWFDTEKALELGLSVEGLKYSLSYFHELFPNQPINATRAKHDFVSTYVSHDFQSILDYYSYITPDMKPYDSDHTTAGYRCRGCEDENRTIDETILDRSLCYVFHLKPVESAFGTYSGIRYLRITLVDRTAGLIPYSPDWYLYFQSPADTFLSVHPKVSVRAFHHNTVRFDMYQFSTLNKPESPCVEDVDQYAYSASACMGECHNELYKEYLNCSLVWLAPPSSRTSPADLCNHVDALPPYGWTLAEFFPTVENSAIDEKAADVCVRRCPRKCRRMVYSTTLQMQDAFGSAEGGSGRGGVSAERSTGDTSVIEMFFKHGAGYQGGVTILEEMHTYSFTQLVNNIGGTLGLFVGGTIMTFAQLLLFGISFGIRKLSRRWSRTVGSESTARVEVAVVKMRGF